MKKSLLILQAAIISSAAFADNENYDGQDVSGSYFMGAGLANSSWVGATAINVKFF